MQIKWMFEYYYYIATSVLNRVTSENDQQWWEKIVFPSFIFIKSKIFVNYTVLMMSQLKFVLDMRNTCVELIKNKFQNNYFFSFLVGKKQQNEGKKKEEHNMSMRNKLLKSFFFCQIQIHNLIILISYLTTSIAQILI